MTDTFATFDPAAWVEDDVLLIQRPVSASPRPRQRRAYPWAASIAVSMAVVALANVVSIPKVGGGPSDALVVARDCLDAISGPTATRQDVVPQGYWKKLDSIVALMPELADDSADADYEPFI